MMEPCYCGSPDCPKCGMGSDYHKPCDICGYSLDECQGHVTELDSLAATPAGQGLELEALGEDWEPDGRDATPEPPAYLDPMRVYVSACSVKAAALVMDELEPVFKE